MNQNLDPTRKLIDDQLERLREMELDESELRVMHAYLVAIDPTSFRDALNLVDRARP